jgi:CBS domain-containing protein
VPPLASEKEDAMKISEVMTTGVISAHEHEPVRRVIELMVMRHCGSIPIVREVDWLAGIITVRDILLPLYPNLGDYVHDHVRARDFEEMEIGYGRMLDLPAADIMTADPMTVSPSDPVLKAASYMGLKNLRRIPVVDEGRLVGMVSIGDINRGLFLRRSHTSTDR